MVGILRRRVDELPLSDPDVGAGVGGGVRVTSPDVAGDGNCNGACRFVLPRFRRRGGISDKSQTVQPSHMRSMHFSMLPAQLQRHFHSKGPSQQTVINLSSPHPMRASAMLIVISCFVSELQLAVHRSTCSLQMTLLDNSTQSYKL